MSKIVSLFKRDVAEIFDTDPDYLDSEHWAEFVWETPIQLSVGNVTTEKLFGGEGQGYQYWVVFRLETPDQRVHYLRIDGWYDSYDGGYYDGKVYEVYPTQKMVTVFE